MQAVVVDKPYHFVPPHEGRLWPALLQRLTPWYLQKCHGVCSVECQGAERIANSLGLGHGVLVTPNHCRPCDPMTLGVLARAVRRPFYTMASRHLFEGNRLQTWLLRRAGAFSVYREGMDREALKTAIEILKRAERPLVLFPEGVITRTNDRLNNLMDGTAFIARSAAKQLVASRPQGKVVVHPVAIRYRFQGDIEAALAPVLREIETRLTWTPKDLGLIERIYRVGGALLCLKEIEYFGEPQSGSIAKRLEKLTNGLLEPLEKEWLKSVSTGAVVSRVKKLRAAIMPDLILGELTEAERARRWRHLADLYLAQQLSFYPPDYVGSRPTPERLLETVERFEEDLTDRTRVHRPIHATIRVGEALEVSPSREKGGADPLMEEIRSQLEALLTEGQPP